MTAPPMRIGFYAPMKHPNHPVPSGDRQMARDLIAALAMGGHAVEVVSTMRSFLAESDPARAVGIDREAAAEVERLSTRWRDPSVRPDLLFAYHLYYKAPDLVALPLARRFGLPYLTAEASYARKREAGPWAARQARVVEAVRAAALNLCFTPNDRSGLVELVEGDRLADLPPFIDEEGFAPATARASTRCELITVAMMRPGDKLASHRFLAEALVLLGSSADWRLTIVGDGPARAEVEEGFARLSPGRLRWLGTLSRAGIALALQAADLMVWPGFNEAFGLCYLEAAASGLPCIAVTGEGTPSVIRDGQTGLLTPPDTAAYASAVARLVEDRSLRTVLGAAARRFVLEERSLACAAVRLDEAVQRARHLHRTSGATGTHV